MSFLFGYYGLGLRAMAAARLGLQVAGDNISNATTPGYARRRVEQSPGFPIRVPGGIIDQGVDVERVNRLQDRLVEASLSRERGGASQSEELLRGLRDLETIFGAVDGEGVLAAYDAFSDALNELSGQSDSLVVRRNAVAAAETLALRFRDGASRLQNQRRAENQAVAGFVTEINKLAGELADLNREIAVAEGGGEIAAPLRDKRFLVIEKLSELTGGTAVPAGNGTLLFALPGGTTLVSGLDALPFTTSTDTAGALRIASGADGSDVTDRLRGGRLGAVLQLRDVEIPAQLATLDSVAQDLIDRANALTTSAFDLNGNPGGPLFATLPSTPGAAAAITVAPSIAADAALLAVSATGAPGDGSIALALAGIQQSGSAALAGRAPGDVLAEERADLGASIARTDVAAAVSADVVASLEAQREAVSGVSLDEEAVALVQYQQAYEAGARFIQVLNEVTEITLSLV